MASTLPQPRNLLAPLPEAEAPLSAGGVAGLSAERFVPVLDLPDLRLEQIVSYGYPTPDGQWYDQSRPEWVLLLRGTATLILAPDGSEQQTLDLASGDSLVIPAGLRHRVASVSADAVWLALHFTAAQEAGPESAA